MQDHENEHAVGEGRVDQLPPAAHGLPGVASVDGKPLIFGKERDKGIILDGVTPKVVKLDDGYSKGDLLVHHEKEESPVMAHILANIEFYGGPVPVGIFRSIDKPRYEEMLIDQMNDTIEKNGKGDIQKLLDSGYTWNVN